MFREAFPFIFNYVSAWENGTRVGHACRRVVHIISLLRCPASVLAIGYVRPAASNVWLAGGSGSSSTRSRSLLSGGAAKFLPDSQEEKEDDEEEEEEEEE